MTTLVVTQSQNKKLGEGTAATYRTQDTCPSSCPFLDNGCYARGRIFSLAKKYGIDDVTQVLRLVKTVPFHGLVRLNVSGDFLLPDGSPDEPYIHACNLFVAKRPDVAIIAYTHAWRQLQPGMFDFVVNASCETPADAADAVAAGWQVALVDDGGLLGTKIAGRTLVRCPEETRGVTCVDCRACASDKRTRPIIVFEPHGMGANKAAAAVAAARERSAE